MTRYVIIFLFELNTPDSSKHVVIIWFYLLYKTFYNYWEYFCLIKKHLLLHFTKSDLQQDLKACLEINLASQCLYRVLHIVVWFNNSFRSYIKNIFIIMKKFMKFNTLQIFFSWSIIFWKKLNGSSMKVKYNNSFVDVRCWM